MSEQVKRRLVTLTIQGVMYSDGPEFRENHDEQRAHIHELFVKEFITDDEMLSAEDRELTKLHVEGLEDL